MSRNPARLTFLALSLLLTAAALAATDGSPYLDVRSNSPEFTEIRWEGGPI
ncbi:MAG: hypothetical protein IPG71_06675 [bacterium]|nr:hypothetical protein [bacterium]